MPDERNNITTVFTADISNFSKSTQELNRYISTVNAEFRNATAGMSDWSKSADGLEAKLKQLNGTLDAQKKKLAETENAYAKLKAEGKENTAEAQRLYIKLQKQQAEVKNTEASIEKYTKALKNCDKQTVKAEKSTGNFARTLASTAKTAVLGIAAAAAGAVTGFFALAESTRELREDMAKLDSAFSASKLSADSASDTYKTLFGAIGESDTAVEASQQIALLANSEEEAAKWAEIATGVVGTFGDALKPETFYEAANETIKLGEATGAFTQMLEGTGYSVDEFNAGLAACTTESEKQAYMLDISNKLLGDASAAYNETAKDIIEAREAEAELSKAMSELGAIAEPIMTTLKLLAADLLTSITPFVELIGEGLTGALNGSADAAATLAEGINGIVKTLLEKITTMLPMAINIILELIPAIINTLLDALPEILDTLLEMVAQIINMLAEVLPQILQKVAEILPMLIQSIIDALPQLVQALLTLVISLVDALPSIITTIINALPQLIQSLIDAMIGYAPQVLDAAITLFMTIIDALPVIIAVIIENLPRIINSIIGFLTKAYPMILNNSIELLMAIIDALPTIINLLVKEVPRIVFTIINALISNLPALIQAAVQLFFGILTAIPKIIVELGKNIPSIITAISSGLENGAGDMAKAGLNLIKGVWEGISGAAGWLKEKITGFAGNVAGWFKKAFKIESPSKLMEDEVGEYLGEGVGIGVVNSIPKVKKNLAKFGGFVTDSLGTIGGAGFNAGNYSTAAGGAASGTVNNNSSVVNVYQTFEKMPTSRYALHLAKLETVNAVKYARGGAN